MNVGIVGYGAYIPFHYLAVEELEPKALKLGLIKKSIPGWDEDSVTMAVAAGNIALEVAQVKSTQVGAVYVGSESPPYAVNPSSTIVADTLNIHENYKAVDLQFACKAATAAVQMAMAQVDNGQLSYSLVIGSDASQARPGDVLEWSAGAAAAAVVLGKEGVIARMLGMMSYTSDTPDFWRREGQKYPEHAGRFTGEPGYFKHVTKATTGLLEKLTIKPEDITYAVFHMPNGKFPLMAAQQLGFKPHQVEPFLTVKEVGNPYSASALLGLIAVLERLKPGERVLMTAYGSGAGADAMVFEATEMIVKKRWGGLKQLIEKRRKMTLTDYLSRRGS